MGSHNGNKGNDVDVVVTVSEQGCALLWWSEILLQIWWWWWMEMVLQIWCGGGQV
ncbi:hypothetical protein A2U01_0077301, partial [Trifolium medium]|nr:hypothetical protein [Trifolium medium]